MTSDASPGRIHVPPTRGASPERSHLAASRRGALSDIVVLDLSHALAGPFASTMLGDHGAEVIKIEPLGGEIARAWGPPFYGGETAYFVNLNRNKKSVALDLKHPEGKAIFFRLLERADVVLENLRVGTVARASGSRASSTVRFPASARTDPTAIARRSISWCRPRAA